jgi:hypothetical protein
MFGCNSVSLRWSGFSHTNLLRCTAATTVLAKASRTGRKRKSGLGDKCQKSFFDVVSRGPASYVKISTYETRHIVATRRHSITLREKPGSEQVTTPVTPLAGRA